MYVVAVFLPLVGSLISGTLVLFKISLKESENEDVKNRIDLISQVIPVPQCC